MAKRIDKQELKANLRGYIQRWFQDDPANKYHLGNFYQVTSEEKKTVRTLDREYIKHILIKKAEEICSLDCFELGEEGKLWPAEIHHLMQQIEATFALADNQEAIVAVGDTPLDDDYSNRPYVLHRLPVDFNLSHTIADKDRQAFLDTLMEQLPQFFHDLKGQLASPDMWDILTCFFGRVVSEDNPSSELLYWYGEGSDGKGELSDLFFRNMGATATPLSFNDFHSRFGGEPLINRRFVRIDEVPKGNFMTDRVKEFTGGNKTLLIERKGRPHVIIKSRLAFMFTSNNTPSFDNSMAQRRRLRYIESKPRQGQLRDVQSELDASFSCFLGYCLINYAKHGYKIPQNTDEVLADLAEDTYSAVDSWISENIEYAPGTFILNETIQKMLDINPYGHVKNKQSIIKRLQSYFANDVVKNFSVEPFREGGGRRRKGWYNVQPKSRGFGGINKQFLQVSIADDKSAT